jgi:hypothetical protein
MSTLAQFASELKAWFSNIDPLATQTLVQRAYRDIRLARDWSFNRLSGVWFAPSPISSGTCTTAFLSKSVVFDATAAPLLNAQAITQPPVQPLVMRQFRVTGGPIYNIVGWNGVNTATLDRPYTEQGAAGTSFYVYQPYVQAPSVDFKRWLSWTDPLNDYRFRYRNLYRTKTELDRKDPQRTSYSIPIWIATHDYVTVPGDTQARPRFEAWPHPVQQIGYVNEWMVNGDSVTLTSLLPSQVSDQTIVARSRHYAHELVANQPNTDAKTKAYHMNMQKRADAEYFDLLNRDKLNDNSIFDATIMEENSGPVLNGPLSADFIQSHELFYIG